jgi:AraC-like DNA-binding protein
MAASGVKGTGRMASFNGGKDCCMVGGLFAFAGNHADLLGVLPPIVHLRKESDKAAMRWSLERMMEELREPQPGGFLMSQHLAHMMLVQALRLHMADGANGEVGWLFAMADSQIRTAIECIHSNPAHRWTVEELAQHAGMSRSGFALRFKETVGEAPMEYLTRWRMFKAQDRLRNSNDSIAEIAVSLGYESESAFSTAFKRLMGRSPRQYGRGAEEVLSRTAKRLRLESQQLELAG